MWKKAVIGATALVIAGSMMVYAQQRGGEFDRPGGVPGGMLGTHMGMGGWRPSADDLAAFADARIAALHAGLRLNADQEKNWPSFEQALRDFSKLRIDRLASRRDQQPAANPVERLQRRADALTSRGTALKHLADTAAPLYQSLDEAQRHRFMVLARLMRPHQERDGVWRERFHMRGGDGLGMRRFGDGDSMRGPRGDMGGGTGGGMRDDDYRGPL
jgi:hypothetical protein